jgi:hypothetical protein
VAIASRSGALSNSSALEGAFRRRPIAIGYDRRTATAALAASVYAP